MWTRSHKWAPPVPDAPLLSGGMYWWYLSFLILGLMSRGFRGRGRWLKFKGGGRDEAQVGLGGRAVCKHTDCSVFRQTANHNTVLVINLRAWHMQDINVNVNSVYSGWRVCPARRLNSSKSTCKRLTNLQMTVCARADIYPRSLCGECVNLRGKHGAPPQVQIDSNEFRAAYSRDLLLLFFCCCFFCV